jgi:hypothetical protein
VLREADRLNLVEIEGTIAEFGRRARDGRLGIEDLQGGTFTISNGGVYGSLMSTPILNAPQSGILGMHRIEERPVVHKGQIVARPMMYLALSYDHRVVDGKEAVTFLVRVKECLEDPALHSGCRKTQPVSSQFRHVDLPSQHSVETGDEFPRASERIFQVVTSEISFEVSRREVKETKTWQDPTILSSSELAPAATFARYAAQLG